LQSVFFLESLVQLGAVPIQTLENMDKVYNVRLMIFIWYLSLHFI